MLLLQGVTYEKMCTAGDIPCAFCFVWVSKQTDNGKKNVFSAVYPLRSTLRFDRHQSSARKLDECQSPARFFELPVQGLLSDRSTRNQTSSSTRLCASTGQNLRQSRTVGRISRIRLGTQKRGQPTKQISIGFARADPVRDFCPLHVRSHVT